MSTTTKSAERELCDDEGENSAVRSFLMQHSCDRSITVAAMAQHMSLSGWPYEYWPTFARQVDNAGQHLTKAGAQIWIRHLFSLERAAIQGTSPDPRAAFEQRFAGATFQRNPAGHPCDYMDARVEALWDGYKAGREVMQAAEPVVLRLIQDENAAPDRAPSTAPQPWQDRMTAHYAKGSVQCRSAEHFMAAELADWQNGAPSTDSAADAKWKRLLKAASTYATGYCQDEADPGYGPGDLVCGVEQHERAKELFAAIAALQPEGGKP